jgi:hypothetical protein
MQDRPLGLLAIVDACRAMVTAWDTAARTEDLEPTLNELCRVLEPRIKLLTDDRSTPADSC